MPRVAPPFAASGFFARRAAVVVTSLIALLLSCTSPTEPPEPVAKTSPPAPLLAGDPPKRLERLGEHSHPITTSVPEVQGWFDQGLALVYGFNHDAAMRAFMEGARLDPQCAMCWWGVAYSLGPNINAPMGPKAGGQAYAAAQHALALASGVGEAERDYIQALAQRYGPSPETDDRPALDRTYADAMRGVWERHPEDTDAATLYAEALMDTMPWDYWTDEAQPREDTELVLTLLESVIEREPDHLGANHYYIHATEEFFPEKAEPSADRLSGLAPDAGHLVHMPSHIFWRVGRYEDAVTANVQAVAADEQFFVWCRPGDFYRAAYYPHNIHFLWAAAATQGRSELALQNARRLAAKTSEGLADFPFLQEFQSIPILTLVRFGRWDDVLGEPLPSADHPYLVAISHYARGLAYVRTGDLAKAQAELEQLRFTAAGPAMEELILAGATATARSLAGIGEAHLAGELAAAEGRLDDAVTTLEQAVARQDELVYMEPPPWFFPTRQALGAVLLKAGRAAEAEEVYLVDLDKVPKNGWSLFGLAQSLDAQGRQAEAAATRQGFGYAWAQADVELVESRF